LAGGGEQDSVFASDLPFRPGKIADYLQRFHQLTLAVSSVHRVLVRHGMNRLPGSQKHRSHAKRWQRYEKAQPGHRLQMDVTFLERIPGTRKRFYQLEGQTPYERMIAKVRAGTSPAS
jgi:hypothetical protein